MKPALPVLPALAALLAAALTPSALQAAATNRPAPAVTRGAAFAAAHCAACHGITANSSSPNPEAPPWDDIVNRPGTTARTLVAFLTDAHNYPAAMDFTVDRRAIRNIAAYMFTLRKPGYKPTR